MKKIFITLVLISSFRNLSIAQEEPVTLTVKCLDYQMPYRDVTVIDLRPVQTLGYVEKGAFNKNTPLVYNGSFPDSLKKYFISRDNSNGSNRELAIILYELYANERSQGMNGRIKLSIRFFEGEKKSGFNEILTLDTIYDYDGFDVTGKLKRKISENFCDIGKQISKGKFKNDSVHNYSIYDLMHIDSIEKKEIPAYNVERMKQGV
jgi:hypothetical protein